MHQQPNEYRVITWVERSPFPLTIMAKLPLEFEYNYATYKLDHIGPRGC